MVASCYQVIELIEGYMMSDYVRLLVGILFEHNVIIIHGLLQR